MQNIHVKRYETPGLWAGQIEPEDRSWVLFIDSDNEATFWRKCEIPEGGAKSAEPGKVIHCYIDAELPRGVAREHSGGFVPSEIERALPAPSQWPGPLDFTVTPNTEGPGFWASLNARAVTCLGETEHEAIRNLLNYVAQLCVAGCLDHTGAPVPAVNQRRYRAVWPDTENPPGVETENVRAAE